MQYSNNKPLYPTVNIEMLSDLVEKPFSVSGVSISFHADTVNSPYLREVHDKLFSIKPSNISFGKRQRHTYFHYEDNPSLKQMKRLLSHSSYLSSLFINGNKDDLSAKKFFTTLVDFENNSRGKGNHLMHLYTFMLPSDWNPKYDFTDMLSFNFMSKFLRVSDKNRPDSVGSKNTILPYFYTITSAKTLHSLDKKSVLNASEDDFNCFYLIIFSTERFYTPDGFDIVTRYKNYVYFDPSKQVNCSKDTLGAVIQNKPGDVKSIKKSVFSQKTGVNFQRKSSDSFKKLTFLVKNWLSNQYASNNYLKDAYAPLLPRLSGEKISKSRKHDRKKIVIINKLFASLEDKFRDFINIMRSLNCYDTAMFFNLREFAKNFITELKTRLMPGFNWSLKTSTGRKVGTLKVSYGRVLWKFKEDFDYYRAYFEHKIDVFLQKLVLANKNLCF